jgi:hypothetical protein
MDQALIDPVAVILEQDKPIAIVYVFGFSTLFPQSDCDRKIHERLRNRMERYHCHTQLPLQLHRPHLAAFTEHLAGLRHLDPWRYQVRERKRVVGFKLASTHHLWRW